MITGGMMKQQVVVSTCDRCHTEVTEPLKEVPRQTVNDPFELPKGWLLVKGETAHTTVFSLDLCENCKLTVLEAAGAARMS